MGKNITESKGNKMCSNEREIKMKIIEQQYKLNEPAPTQCSYCDEEKNFLMVKPVAMAFNGEVHANVNMTNSTKWICLECLTMDLDAMGHSVDIQEYE